MNRAAIVGLLTVALAGGCQPAVPAPPAGPAGRPAPAAALPTAVPAPAVQAVPGTSKDVWYLDPWSLGYEKPATRGGTFTYNNNNAPANLNPFANNLRAHAFIDVVYDSLLGRRVAPGKLALAAEIICRLCDSWEVKADKLTYTFRLRQGVKFHDGQPFTAEDVRFTLEKAMDPQTAYEFRSSFARIDKVEVLDPHTVAVVTKTPDADLLRALGWGILPIVSKQAYDSGADMNKAAVGTGPFKLEKFDSATEFVAARNPDFWIPERPILDRIQSRFIPDFSTRQAAFATRQIDVITGDNTDQMKPLGAIVPGLKSEPYDPNHSPALPVNLNKAPFSDKRVRRAMHLAIDRDEMSKQLTGGLGAPNGIPGTPGAWLASTTPQEELARMPGFRQAKEQDLAEARRLMAEAGYAGGFKATSAHAAGSTHNPEWNESTAAQLKKIGIDVTLDAAEGSVFIKRETECSHDMWIRVSAGSNSVPALTYAQWVTGGSQNFCKYANPEYDKLYAELTAELDQQKRWPIIRKLQVILMDDLPMIPLPERAPFAGWQPYLHNWRNYGATSTHPLYPTSELIWTEKR